MIPVKYSLIAAAVAAFIGLESYTVHAAYQRGYKAADAKHELASNIGMAVYFVARSKLVRRAWRRLFPNATPVIK